MCQVLRGQALSAAHGSLTKGNRVAAQGQPGWLKGGLGVEPEGRGMLPAVAGQTPGAASHATQ